MSLLLPILAGLCCYLAFPTPTLDRLKRPPEPFLISPRPSVALRWRIATMGGATLIVGLLLPGAGAIWAMFVAAALGWICSGYFRWPEQTDRLRAECPDALELLAVCLSAGAPTALALRSIAEVSPDSTAQALRRVLARFDVGQSAAQAWQELRDNPVWCAPARELIRGARSGSSLAETLRRQAEDARYLAKEEALRRARGVAVKSVAPLMACFLPAFIAVGVVPIVAGLLRGFLS